MEKIGRNDPCHCGSGKKYKKCHEAQDTAAEAAARAKAAAVRAEEAAVEEEAKKDDKEGAEGAREGVDRTAAPAAKRKSKPLPQKGPVVRRRAPGG